jgi:small subunit ribosomal protein S9
MPEKKEKKTTTAKKEIVRKKSTTGAVVKKIPAKKMPAKMTSRAKESSFEQLEKVQPRAVAIKSIKIKAKTKQRAAERRNLKEKRPENYFFAIGRRKRAVAQTKLWLGNKLQISVNGQDYEKYFPIYELRQALLAPLKAVGLDEVKIEVKILGGGQRGQAEAVRLGIARALLLVNADHRLTLKKLGFLTRDPREKERKKFGLKKARRAPQWAKR